MKILNSYRVQLLLATVAVSSIQTTSAAPVLEEVMVSAQKRTESMQDVPVAVSALTGDDLANTGFRDVSDIAAQVPSLIVTSNVSPLNTSFRMRRIGNEGNIPTFEPDTALIIDGAFRSRSGLGLGDLVDVLSVEVLKGPQSTLYGKNAGAGVISVTTEGPTQEFEAMLEGSVGSEGYRQLKGSISGPLAEKLSGRLSYAGSKRDPLIENLVGEDGDNQNGSAIRGQLRYDFTDRLTAKLIIGNVARDMKPMMGDTFNSEAQIRIINGTGFAVNNNDPSDRKVESDDNIEFEQDSLDGVLTVEYATDAFTLTSISSFEDYTAEIRQFGAEELPMNIATFIDTQAGESFSQELRLASDPASKLDWLAGMFYYENDFTRGDEGVNEFVLEEFIEEYGQAVANEIATGPLMTTLPGAGVNTPVLGVEGDTGDFLVEQSTKSFGIFSQVGMRLTESLEIAAGLRYSWEEKTGKVTQSNQTSSSGCVPPLNRNLVCTLTPDGNNFDDTDDWSAITGNVSLSYFMNDQTLLYGTIARGFKAGGYSLQFGAAADGERPFDDESVDHLEFGWKTEFWDSRARINGAIFHTEYESFQNASFVSLVFAVNNAELVVVDGIEVDSTWLLSDNLTANVNFAYIEAVYDEYTGGQCYYGRAENSAGQCDLSGEVLPFAPKLTGNISLQWEQPLNSGDLYARMDHRYVGAANYSSELDPRHDEPAFNVTNLRLGWRDSRFDIAAWVNNAADEVYFAQKAPANVASAVDKAVASPEGSYQTFTGAPRTAGITFRAYF